jgi:anaerobic selenocysteine-containing dehydrogenase
MLKFFSSKPIHDPIHKQASADEIKNTTCYMCACRCSIRAHLRDGESILH